MEHFKVSIKRYRHSTVQESRSKLIEVLSDKGRILTSSGFRRLQSKAQVFSLETNAAVRTRLSHSLEVSSVGCIIANKIVETLKIKLLSVDLADWNSLPCLVENACYLHDIGNPPFGHLGEYAIQKWFQGIKSEITDRYSAPLLQECLDNYINFDGNAQGLRIVSKLQYLNDEHGLNLTYSTLGSMIKYPYSGTPVKNDTSRKKNGIFFSEKKLFLDVWAELFKKHPYEAPHEIRYFPSKIMEASDDISYCLSDIEDALEKGIVEQSVFFRFLDEQLAKPEVRPNEYMLKSILAKVNLEQEEPSKIAHFLNFKVNLTQSLVNSVVEHCIEAIERGDLSSPGPIIDRIPEANFALDAIKQFSKKYIFVSEEAVSIELSGFNIVQNLLNKHKCLLELENTIIKEVTYKGSKKHHRAFPLESRLLTSLPSRHLRAYEDAVESDPENEIVYRIQLIVDYISGMTDNHALEVSNKLNGALYA